MTQKPEKNVFLEARRYLNAAMKAADILKRHVEQCDCEGWKEDFHLASLDARKTIATTLHELDMSMRKIVDWGKTNTIFRHAWLESFIDNNDDREDEPEVQAIIVNLQRMAREINNSAFFFEGTERDTLEQEQAEAEQRYYKDRRIDAACDTDNAKDEEFCGPDGEGEKT